MKKVSEKLAYCENSQYICGVKKSERYEVNRKRKGVNLSNQKLLKIKTQSLNRIRVLCKGAFRKADGWRRGRKRKVKNKPPKAGGF